ncbi:nuclear transport factor 2 family protein [Methylocystis sp. JAN1]|uniref:nuclear transport factor 2 family protein n=1 Tax=Methylocystis sp. JAN1 TaxID=3397211 RepID=UPI003FA2B902
MSGDTTATLRFFMDDVELSYNGRVGMFQAGQWRGSQALREHLRRTDIEYEPLDAEVSDVVVEGDRTAVRWTSHWRRRATGEVYCMDMAHFLRWRNERVAEMHEFLDHHAPWRSADETGKSFEEMLNPPHPGLSRDEMARRMMALGNFSHRGPDIELFRSYYAPDVVCEFVGDPRTIAYAGRHRGIEALLSVVRSVAVDFEQVGCATPEMVIDGGSVATRRTVEWRHRGTGRRGIVELADFVRFEDGRIVELVEFRDSVALLQMQD